MKWKNVIGIFLTGLFLGVVGSLYVGWKSLTLYAQGKLNDKMVAIQLEGYSRNNHLTADQKPKVLAILKEHLAELHALRVEAGQKREDLRHLTDQKIRLLLTPEQRQVFDLYVQNAEQRLRKVYALLGESLN